MSADKKYQVFLSSTFIDLKEEREAAISSVLDLGHIPSGMEIFPATDVEQFEYIKKVIDQCDYYVLILKARYGSKDFLGVSFTEREYDYAVSNAKFALVFPYARPEELLRGADVDPETLSKFMAFRRKAMNGRLVRSWETLDQLRSSLVVGLTHAFSNHPQAGWVRGGSVSSEDLRRQMSTALDAAVEIAQKQPDWPIEVPVVDRNVALDWAVEHRSLFEGAEILWVDDRPSNNRNEARMLRSLGALITFAATTDEAIRASYSGKEQHQPFHIIISDISRDFPTPQPSAGIDMVPRLREAGFEQPVILYVGRVDPNARAPDGAFGLTNRPDRLLQIVVNALLRARKQG